MVSHERVGPVNENRRFRCTPEPAEKRLLNQSLALVAAAAALGLAALGAVFFLNAYKAKATAVLANNARPFDALREATEKLLKALRITELNTHALNHHPSI
jgi:hypothetical protein